MDAKEAFPSCTSCLPAGPRDRRSQEPNKKATLGASMKKSQSRTQTHAVDKIYMSTWGFATGVNRISHWRTWLCAVHSGVVVAAQHEATLRLSASARDWLDRQAAS